MFAAVRGRQALAQEGGAPEPLLQFGTRPDQQRRIRLPEPAQDLARRRRIGPGLGVAGGDLSAVGETRFECRAGLSIHHDDVVAGFPQEPRTGHADDAGAEDEYAHLR